ncbi:MAG: isoprenylcysteine carboxylmethyltransferase family protein [Terracidiphilus sp.]|jgi:protein-S-isoprenylcysteine O-methyltransferase Ste14
MLRVALFLAASAAILPVSWRPLRDWRTHGFYRFFAFELLLALILLNAPLWFHDPFSARQWAAWSLGIVSIGLAIEGFRLLRVIGRPRPTAEAGAKELGTNHPIENTTTLVTVGAYRLIRHPLYASLLALAWCAWLKNPLGAGSIALTVGASGFLLATAIAEEKENLQRFGAAYAEYMKSTRRFIPYVF